MTCSWRRHKICSRIIKIHRLLRSLVALNVLPLLMRCDLEAHLRRNWKWCLYLAHKSMSSTKLLGTKILLLKSTVHSRHSKRLRKHQMIPPLLQRNCPSQKGLLSRAQDLIKNYWLLLKSKNSQRLSYSSLLRASHSTSDKMRSWVLHCLGWLKVQEDAELSQLAETSQSRINGSD